MKDYELTQMLNKYKRVIVLFPPTHNENPPVYFIVLGYHLTDDGRVIQQGWQYEACVGHIRNGSGEYVNADAVSDGNHNFCIAEDLKIQVAPSCPVVDFAPFLKKTDALGHSMLEYVAAINCCHPDSEWNRFRECAWNYLQTQADDFCLPIFIAAGWGGREMSACVTEFFHRMNIPDNLLFNGI